MSKKNTNGKKVLVVDDSKLQLIHARVQLEKVGFEVHTTDNIWVNGLVSSFKPDLILMDVELDGFNGADSVKALKHQRKKNNMVVFLHSGKSAAELETLCGTCEADGYICKKNGSESLISVVTASLGVA